MFTLRKFEMEHSTTPTLLEVNNASFATSSSAAECCDLVQRLLGQVSKNIPARLAIAKSLALESQPPKIPAGDRGPSIRGTNLFGDDIRVWLACIIERHKQDKISLADFQDLVARHWARGAELLKNSIEAADADFDRFVHSLASEAGMPSSATSLGHGSMGASGQSASYRKGPVVVSIGELSVNLANQQKVSWVLNAAGRPPHIAVVGAAGTGKTRSSMSMVRDIARQSGAPVLLFDMAKGDIAADATLVKTLGASVIASPDQAIPLDVLYSERSENAIKSCAKRFRESFKRIPKSRIGDAQGDILREAAEVALRAQRPTTIRHVFDALRNLYNDKQRKEDVVTATFNDMVGSDLFTPQLSPSDFFSRSWVLDLHAADEVTQRLVVFLLMDAAHRYLSGLEDAPLDSGGHRSLRLLICIDEARRVMGYDHDGIVSLVRESRSKGGAMMFMSQSPDDFNQGDENYFENIGLGVCFKTNAKSAALTAMLGQQVDLGALGSGVCVTRLADVGFMRVKAW
jgi:DNA sulfur modification protein DndE